MPICKKDAFHILQNGIFYFVVLLTATEDISFALSDYTVEVELALEEYDLLQCVDRGLETMGSQIKRTVYWKISILHGSLHDTIVTNPKIFGNVLREIFGDTAIVVERSIIQELENAFELEQGDRQDLISVLEGARRQISPTSCAPEMMISS